MAQPSDQVFIKDLPGDVNEEMLTSVFSKCNVAEMKAMPTKIPGGKGSALIRFGSVDEATWIVENLNGNIPEGLTEAVVVRYAVEKGAGKGNDFAGKAVGGYGKSPTEKGKGKFAPGPYDAGKSFSKGAGAGKGGGGGKPGRALDAITNLLNDMQMLPGGVGEMPLSNQLYISGLPANTTDADLYRIFSPFGSIPTRGVRAMIDKSTGLCSGIGFVDFIEQWSADAATLAISGTTMPDGAEVRIRTKREGGGKGAKDGKGGKDGKW